MNHLTMECWNADSLLHRFTDSTQVLGSDNHSWNNNESYTNRVWVCLFEQYQYLPSIYLFFSVMPSMLKPSSRPFFQPPLSPPTLATEVRPDSGCSLDIALYWAATRGRFGGLAVWELFELFLFSCWFHDFIWFTIQDSIRVFHQSQLCREINLNQWALPRASDKQYNVKQIANYNCQHNNEWSWCSWLYTSSMLILPRTF